MHDLISRECTSARRLNVGEALVLRLPFDLQKHHGPSPDILMEKPRSRDQICDTVT